MATLGAALARGLAGYASGRREREQDDYQRAQLEQQRQRQERLDAENRERQALLMRQITQQMQIQQGQESDRQAATQRERYESGYRTTADANRMGGAFSMGDAAAPQGGMMGAAGGALADYGQAMQQAARTPAFTAGGTGYAKIAESNAERAKREENTLAEGLAQQQRAADTQAKQSIIGTLPPAVRQQAMAMTLAQLQQLQAGVVKDRITPKAPASVNMQVIQTADGPMAFNPRTGQAQPITANGQQVRGQPGRTQLPTEGERKAAALFGVAQQGYETLEGLLTARVDPRTGERQYKSAPSLTERMKQSVGMGVGNVITGDEQRQMSQAAQQMADMWLRYTSGAAVPETEVQRFAQTFTPLPGDDAGTLKQKAEARKRMIGALQQAAGRALQTPGREGTAAVFGVDGDTRPPLDVLFKED